MDFPPVLEGAERAAFSRSVLSGLTRTNKALEPRWLYDGVGAKLFEAITQLDHYYLTRTEMALIERHAAAMADALGAGVTIVEPGSGEAIKVRPLLGALGARAAGYVPIDIAAGQLRAVSSEMNALYPDLAVTGIAADFFHPFSMDKPDNAVIFFPGSTVGNMTPAAAIEFFKTLQKASGARRFLIGFDLLKDRRVLLDAYDDPAGVTAAFTMNILQRINRELDGGFDLSKFRYRARFDEDKSAVEMGLESTMAQSVTVSGMSIDFAAGETIHTEDSRKFSVESFATFAKGANLVPVETWTDPHDFFAVMLLETATA